MPTEYSWEEYQNEQSDLEWFFENSAWEPETTVGAPGWPAYTPESSNPVQSFFDPLNSSSPFATGITDLSPALWGDITGQATPTATTQAADTLAARAGVSAAAPVVTGTGPAGTWQPIPIGAAAPGSVSPSPSNVRTQAGYAGLGGSSNAGQAARAAAGAAQRSAGMGQVGAGQAAGAAAEDATRFQLDALTKLQDYIKTQLDPAALAKLAANQDRTRALDSLALQRETDPGMAQVRQSAQNRVLSSLEGLENGDANRLAKQAAGIASTEANNPQTLALQEKFLARANEELDLGTTLPSDLQAELVQAGLQRAGAVTGRAGSGSGVGRNIATQLFGTAALQLRQQRQTAAQSLSQSAQQLQQSRVGILSNLFPALKANQLADLQAGQNAFAGADAALPNAGVGGTDLVNLYLSKIGALGQTITDIGKVGAAGSLAGGTAAGQVLGGASASGGSASVKLPDYSSWLNKVGLT